MARRIALTAFSHCPVCRDAFPRDASVFRFILQNAAAIVPTDGELLLTFRDAYLVVRRFYIGDSRPVLNKRTEYT